MDRQLSFVDYLMAQSDGLLKKAQHYSQRHLWEDVSRTMDEWFALSNALASWMEAAKREFD